MSITRRVLTSLLALVACAWLVAACTVSDKGNKASAGGGSIKKIDALSGVKVKVGSKEFDEQLLLGQIAIETLQAAGASPQDKTDITGSDNVRRALTSGAIDLYWEYTGTAWVSFLKHTKGLPDPVDQFDAVAKADAANGITWWARAPANNTYAIAMKASTAAKYKVHTLSDYAALAKRDPSAASLCLDSEFQNRDDGLPGVEKLYGFNLPRPNQHLVDIAVVFPAMAKGTCNFGVVNSTDGRIVAQHLQLLDDNKKFFPVYNPAISMRSPLAKKYPQLKQVFSSVAAKLTTDALASMNKKISVDGAKPATVAHDWLKSQGFIG